jgi:predicted RNA methylase
LRVVPGIRLRLQGADSVQIGCAGQVFEFDAHAMLLLHAFRAAMPLSAGLARLRGSVTGSHDWMALLSTLTALRNCGVLIDADGDRGRVEAPQRGSGVDSMPVQIAMLADRARTASFLAAIRQSVRHGDVVVDLGTGTGVLAIAAALAGAARVYAIEATGIIATARAMIQANGVADRITLVEGHSTQIELPERADLLVSEIIGNDPLGEQILSSTADAVRRFLKPKARVLPAALRVYAAPVQLGQGERERWVHSEALARGWERDYGIDFSALLLARCAAPIQLQVAPLEASRWKRLATPQLVAGHDLSLPLHPRAASRLAFEITASGHLDGLLLWFEAELGASNVLSTDPSDFRHDNHWLHPLQLLTEPLQVAAGQQLVCRRDASSADFAFELSSASVA